MENPIKKDDLGVLLFFETPIEGLKFAMMIHPPKMSLAVPTKR